MNFSDRIDAFESFDSKMLTTIWHDVAKGLEYLHMNDTAHRDLKAKNILVSNQHYSSVCNEDERHSIYQNIPIVCKLADFGKSRSTSIQTAQLHSTTKHVDRYVVYSSKWLQPIHSDSIFSWRLEQSNLYVLYFIKKPFIYLSRD